MTPKILVFAGSARRDSLNRRLAQLAAVAVNASGGEATLIELSDFGMPLYHGDLEAAQGIPEAARRLKALFISHQGLFIISPENNASVSALLKNTLDWVSRPDGGQNGLVPYQGKVAALAAASPGALGGLRGLVHLRAILQSLNVMVISEQFALPRAHESIGADGKLADPRQQSSLAGVAARLVDVARRMAG